MTASNPASAPSTPATKNVFRLHGVNVLNRKNVDSIARLTALEKRRANHILDERQRRDTMNQLLTELSNLVRESETDPITTSSPQPSYTALHSSTSTSSTASTSTVDNDTPGKRPPVKSNSITTLRCAIAEIHRLRSYAGLEPIGSSTSSQSPSMSPSRSTSPVSPTPLLAPSPLELQYPAQPLLAPQGNTDGCSTYPISSTPSSPSGAYQPYQTFVPHPLDSTLAPYSQQHLHYQPHSPPLSPNTSTAADSFPSGFPPLNFPMSGTTQEAPSLPTLYAANTLVALASDQTGLSLYDTFNE